MKVHIARRHVVGGVPIHNRDVRHLPLVSQSFKDDPSKFYYNSLLRRFLPVSSNSGITYPNSDYSFSDPFQSSKNILKSMAKLFEMRNKFLSFYNATPESALRNSPESHMWPLQLFDTIGANYRPTIPSVIIHKYVPTFDTLITGEEIRGFRVDLCKDCLEIYSISIRGNSEFSFEEIHRRIATSIHHCSNYRSESSTLSTHDKRTRYNNLVGNVQPFLLNKVLDWLQGKKPFLRAFVLQAEHPAGSVRFVKPVGYPFGFINRAIENGYTTLEASELDDFLLLSKYRSTAIYALVNSKPGGKKFHDSCTYGMLITRN
ncbi:MAG TPA: hypothetical protein VH796_06780 [Nitrososphaeraceae archaeon]